MTTTQPVEIDAVEILRRRLDGMKRLSLAWWGKGCPMVRWITPSGVAVVVTAEPIYLALDEPPLVRWVLPGAREFTAHPSESRKLARWVARLAEVLANADAGARVTRRRTLACPVEAHGAHGGRYGWSERAVQAHDMWWEKLHGKTSPLRANLRRGVGGHLLLFG